jgi:acyl-CoA thioesterase I
MTLCMIFGHNNDANATPSSGPPPTEGTIVAVGDSLTAGFGLKHSEAYPAQLEKKLNQAGYHWKVVNAGISGETSSGTMSRINWILKLKPDIVILEIGANDGLRGLDPQMVRRNIDKIVTTLQHQGVVVVLVGMQMLRNLGTAYTSQFVAIYPKIAKEHSLIFEPFFLKGVAGDPNLNQADGIHPIGKGYRIVTDNIYPYVVQAIEKKRGKKS